MRHPDYDAYVRTEWDRMCADPKRFDDSLAAVASRTVERVLDVGCGAGQEMAPFAHRGAFGVGVDIAEDVGLAGRELFAAQQPVARIVFARAAGEQLPFREESFDVVVCRVALPYMDNRRALAEMRRVLRKGGVLLLKIHHAWYYLHKLASGARSRDVRSMVHSLRVLLNGALLHFFGRQSLEKPIGRETFQTRRGLRRDIAPLRITREMLDSNPRTPSFLILKPRS